MVIRELTIDATLDLLKRCRLGRLACAKSNQPYICPITFAYHANHLYCTSTIGKKIEWMRANPLVAVLVDEIEEEGAIARSYADAPDVDATVFVTGEKDKLIQPGKIVDCEIVSSQHYDLVAAAVGPVR